MTKFVLHGGNVSGSADGGLAFFKESFATDKLELKILDCLFARPQADWAKSFEGHQELWPKCVPDISLTLEVAASDKFPEQLQKADVLYLAGGVDKALFDGLGGYLTRQAVDGKIIVGSSAGADVLSKYFFNLDTVQIEEGLGLVPIKFIPHYRSDYNAPNIDWDKAEAELKNYKEDLPLVTLREGEFKVFHQ